MSNEYRRQKAIEDAVRVGDRVIMEASMGSVEETDYLTAMVAMRWMEKVTIAVQSRLLVQELRVEHERET